MRKKLLIGLGVVAALLAIFMVVVALQPSTFRVERTATMAAPPADVFAQVNDFHNWDAWSPWAKRDPKMKATYEGPSEGEGAIYRWAGNDEVGEGGMTITESRQSDLIRIKLEFLKPYASTCATEFTFEPKDDQTAVKWSMAGQNTFIGKMFCLFMNMDKMIGGDFEKGLAHMKAVVEAKPEQ